ncbi:hypothetical protein EYF80_036153 [Liparis tanakae]|uniref:Uncharacterized protein n=1 Tax=Liparis tanakae TaxID=230148 RepID=A0A4Z2GK55_9TELE|nr:hypothetical protein EYF80_036153 [Liparis tanakae]
MMSDTEAVGGGSTQHSCVMIFVGQRQHELAPPLSPWGKQTLPGVVLSRGAYQPIKKRKWATQQEL